MPRDDSLIVGAPSIAASPSDVLDEWHAHGPLVHEPTGLDALDAATGGGPVHGTRLFLLGSPDAGKTALQTQVGHVWAERGIAVGFLAVDEEPGDLMTRLAQRVGFSREACERRDPGAIEVMRRHLGSLPIRFYSGEHTIEAAAADLAQWARENDYEATALLVDSIQTARCDAELAAQREMALPQAVEARVRAVRKVATDYRMILMVTSEMGRGAYRAGAESTDPLASAKWSGAIEYTARVMITLHAVKGHDDLVMMQIPKNKHGRRRLADEGTELYLEIDRASQRLSEAQRPDDDEEHVDRDAAAVTAALARAERDAARVAATLAKSPGLSAREIRAALPGVGVSRVDAAMAVLADALVIEHGPNRRKGHHLDGREVPDAVLAHLTANDRARVSWARPPAAEDDDDGTDGGEA